MWGECQQAIKVRLKNRFTPSDYRKQKINEAIQARKCTDLCR